MGFCVTSGYEVACGDRVRVGGVRRTAYIFDVSNVTYTVDGNGYITAISFGTYAGLYKISSTKQSHSGGTTLVDQGTGGNKFFTHDVIIKSFADSPADATAIKNLVASDCTGVILETNNNEFRLYGRTNGLEVTASTQNTGQVDASDTAISLTLTGGEPEIESFVLDTDYETTKALLESYVI